MLKKSLSQRSIKGAGVYHSKALSAKSIIVICPLGVRLLDFPLQKASKIRTKISRMEATKIRRARVTQRTTKPAASMTLTRFRALTATALRATRRRPPLPRVPRPAYRGNQQLALVLPLCRRPCRPMPDSPFSTRPLSIRRPMSCGR
jgi:hypothetical protein